MYVNYSYRDQENCLTFSTVSSPKWLRSIFLRVIIISLYVLLTISLAIYWAFVRRAFIQYGNNFVTVFYAIVENSPWWRANYFIGNISGGIGTFLVDITIVCRRINSGQL